MFFLLTIALGLGTPPPATAPVVRPKATLEIVVGRWSPRMMVQIVTESGTAYALPFEGADHDRTGTLTRRELFMRLLHANWLVATSGKFGIEVFGIRAKGGKVDRIKTLTVTARQQNGREIVKLGGAGGVKVGVREGDGKPGAKPPPVGPDLGPEPYVEFDFTTMPVEERSWHITVNVETALKNLTFVEDDHAPDRGQREALCCGLAIRMESVGFKADVIDKSKVRVYGAVFDGKFYPATKGIVKSPDLKKNELPKVTNPPMG